MSIEEYLEKFCRDGQGRRCEELRAKLAERAAGSSKPATLRQPPALDERQSARSAQRLCVCRKCPNMGGERSNGSLVRCLARPKTGCSSCQNVSLVRGKCPENRWPVELPDGLAWNQDSAGNDGCGCAE